MSGSLKLKKLSEINLVLSGGAAKGIAHIGVLKAIEDLGIKVKRISGSSAGALVSVFYSYGYSPDDMLKLVKEINWLKVFKLRPPKFGLIGWEKAYKVIEELIPVYRIEELKIPVYICCVDLYSGKPIYFNEGELYPVLFGSCAIPGIFEPISYRDYLLVDGGIMNNLPVEPLEIFGEKRVCVDVLPISEEREIKNIIQVLIRSFFLSVRANSDSRKRFCDYVIVPELDKFSPLDIHKADEIFRAGYESALKVLSEEV